MSLRASAASVAISDRAPSCASPKIGAAILGEEGGGDSRQDGLMSLRASAASVAISRTAYHK